MPVTGTWFGLPDFGITEKFAKPTPKPTTFYNPAAAPKIINPVGPSYNVGQPATVYPKNILGAQAPAPSGGGGYTGGGGATGGGGGGGSGNVNDYLQSTPGFEQPNYDAIINPILADLDAQIQSLTGAFPTQEADIRKVGANQLASAQQQFGAQDTSLTQRATEENTKGESAADEARRQYSEIQQGLQARYGGTTGTGAFAAEQAGVQTLKNIGNIRTTVSQNLQKIEDTRTQIKEIARIQYQDIEDKTNMQVNEAKRNLDAQLADIRRQKGELQSRKAELASQAFQIYQNTVNQINSQNATFKQNLYVAQLDAENKLQLATQKGTEAINGMQLGGFNAGQGLDLSGLQPTGFTTNYGGGKLTFAAGEEDEGNFQF